MRRNVSVCEWYIVSKNQFINECEMLCRRRCNCSNEIMIIIRFYERLRIHCDSASQNWTKVRHTHAACLRIWCLWAVWCGKQLYFIVCTLICPSSIRWQMHRIHEKEIGKSHNETEIISFVVLLSCSLYTTHRYIRRLVLIYVFDIKWASLDVEQKKASDTFNIISNFNVMNRFDWRSLFAGREQFSLPPNN